MRTRLALSLVLSAGAAWAQQDPPPGGEVPPKAQDGKERPGKRVHGPGGKIEALWKRIRGKLDLTEEQKTSLRGIAGEYREKLRELGKEAGGGGSEARKELRGRIRDLVEEFLAKVREQLTEEQRAKLDEMIDKMKERARGKKAGRGRPGRRGAGGDSGGESE